MNIRTDRSTATAPKSLFHVCAYRRTVGSIYRSLRQYPTRYGIVYSTYSTTLHTGSPLMNVAYMKYCTRSPASGKDSVITQYVARITTSTDRLRIAVLEDSTHVGMEHMYSYDICTSFLSEGKQ